MYFEQLIIANAASRIKYRREFAIPFEFYLIVYINKIIFINKKIFMFLFFFNSDELIEKARCDIK